MIKVRRLALVASVASLLLIGVDSASVHLIAADLELRLRWWPTAS